MFFVWIRKKIYEPSSLSQLKKIFSYLYIGAWIGTVRMNQIAMYRWVRRLRRENKTKNTGASRKILLKTLSTELKYILSLLDKL